MQVCQTTYKAPLICVDTYYILISKVTFHPRPVKNCSYSKLPGNPEDDPRADAYRSGERERGPVDCEGIVPRHARRDDRAKPLHPGEGEQ